MKTRRVPFVALALAVGVSVAAAAWAAEPQMDPAAEKRARLIQRVLRQNLGILSRAYVDASSVGVSYETQIQQEDELSTEIAAVALTAWVGARKPAEVHIYVLADGVPALYVSIPGTAVGDFGLGKLKFDEFIKRWQISSLIAGAPRPRDFFIQPWMMPDVWSEGQTRDLPGDEALAAVGLTAPSDPPVDEWPAAIQSLQTRQGKATLAVLLAPTVADARRAWEAVVGAAAGGQQAVAIPGHSGVFARRRANVLYVAAGPGFVGRKAVDIASAMAVGHMGKACFADSAPSVAAKPADAAGRAAAAGAKTPAGRAVGGVPSAPAGAGQQGTAGQGTRPGGAGSRPSERPSQEGGRQPAATGKLETAQLEAVVAAGFEDGKPVGEAARFAAPVKEIVLYLKPKAMKLPAQVAVQWRLGEKVIAVQQVTLQSHKGSLVTVFSRSGKGLPPGVYTVAVTAAGKPIGELAFEILK